MGRSRSRHGRLVDPEPSFPCPPLTECTSGRAGARHDGLALVAGRVRGAVGEDEAVDAELRVVHRLAKVAAVAPGLHALAVRVGYPVHQALVHPVPDEAALRAEH